LNKIIVSGRACSGKDDFADYLVEKYGYTKISFALGIYEIARKYFGMTLKDRKLLQAIGQGMREIDPDVWIKAAFKEAEKYDKVVISDLRQSNEYIYAMKNEFVPFRIQADLNVRIDRCVSRDGVQPNIDEWETEGETGADNFDYHVIENNSTKEEFHKYIDRFMEKGQKENKLYIVSGVSGAGKSTLFRAIMDNEITSFTTRPQREGEVNGVDYLFITEEDFQMLLEEDGLIEHAEYSGYRYGITRDEFEDRLSNGDAFIVVEFEGMKQLKEIYPNNESVYIFVEKDEAELHMRSRNDKEQSIQVRLSTYETEIKQLAHYDYLIINEHGKFDETVKKIKKIIGKV
jgi:guanylate kinase